MCSVLLGEVPILSVNFKIAGIIILKRVRVFIGRMRKCNLSISGISYEMKSKYCNSKNYPSNTVLLE